MPLLPSSRLRALRTGNGESYHLLMSQDVPLSTRTRTPHRMTFPSLCMARCPSGMIPLQVPYFSYLFFFPIHLLVRAGIRAAITM